MLLVPFVAFQDTTVLMRDAWLNIEANALAKQKLDPLWVSLQTYCIPSKGWSLSINQSWITKQMLDAIWTHVNGLPAIKHWQTKFHLSDQAWKQIDWDRLEWAYKESKEPARCWAVNDMSFFWSWEEYEEMAVPIGV